MSAAGARRAITMSPAEVVAALQRISPRTDHSSRSWGLSSDAETDHRSRPVGGKGLPAGSAEIAVGIVVGVWRVA